MESFIYYLKQNIEAVEQEITNIESGIKDINKENILHYKTVLATLNIILIAAENAYKEEILIKF